MRLPSEERKLLFFKYLRSFPSRYETIRAFRLGRTTSGSGLLQDRANRLKLSNFDRVALAHLNAINITPQPRPRAIYLTLTGCPIKRYEIPNDA
jgi:hypothetical protein